VIRLYVDGREASALEGDTLIVALLCQVRHLRHSEFDDGVRAGFCLMGAYQDCWVYTEEGERMRAFDEIFALVRQALDRTYAEA